jgi:hypothetical protein
MNHRVIKVIKGNRPVAESGEFSTMESRCIAQALVGPLFSDSRFKVLTLELPKVVSRDEAKMRANELEKQLNVRLWCVTKAQTSLGFVSVHKAGRYPGHIYFRGD